MLKDRRIKLRPPARKKRMLLIHLFLAAVVIGFLLNLATYHVSKTIIEFRTGIDIVGAPSQLGKKSSNYSSSASNINSSAQFENKPTFPLWEQPILFNLTNFSWLLNNPNICHVPQDLKGKVRLMPILIHTEISHYQERHAIRKSFGSIPFYKKWIVRLVFLLGRDGRESLLLNSNPDMVDAEGKVLEEEQQNFGDLVIGSFHDSYHNMTYKHLMGYKWILNFCSEATFVTKMDDDIFLDLIQWLDWRSEDLEKEEPVPDLYCNVMKGRKPKRETASKWDTTFSEWPTDYYPDYCSGCAYGLTVDIIRKIYSVSRDVEYFWIDDVFVTGVLMQVAKAKYNFEPRVKSLYGDITMDTIEYRPFCMNQLWKEKRFFRTIVMIPRGYLLEMDMICLWNKTVHDAWYKLFG